MGATFHCDYCGGVIDGELYEKAIPFVMYGRRLRREEFHYHEQDCAQFALDALEELSGKSPRQTREAERNEYWEQRKAWRRVSMPERESFLLQILGDDRMTIAELTKAFRNKCPGCAIYDTHVRSLVRKMSDRGTLDRIGEPNARGTTRFRYFRKTTLEGPIVDIDRALRDDDSEAVA